MTQDTPVSVNIPYTDIREGTLVDLLKEHKGKLDTIMGACRSKMGYFSALFDRVIMPVCDTLAKRWLKKTNNPYLGEIQSFAKILGKKGVFAFNLSYEWGCTTGVFSQAAGAKLLRVLDWPFPLMGENIVVAHQKGPAGEFHNITWPGVSGIFNAVAAGRFAAAINQAPMRRNWTGIITDWLRNRFQVNKAKGLPPAHLLRKAFETAADYSAAKKMLTEEPIAIPVIYILSGTKPDEGCVIERLENEAVVREIRDGRVVATNHFETSLNGNGNGWMARRGTSAPRMKSALVLPSAEVDDRFTWFKAPIANDFSRLAMTADAGAGTFQVMGTLGDKPVTQVFTLSAPKKD